MLGKIAQPQIYGVQAELFSQFVHGRFQGEAAGGVAGSAHGNRLRRVGPHQGVPGLHIGTGIGDPRYPGHRVGIVPLHGGLGQGAVINGGQDSLVGSPKGDVLHRFLTPAGQSEHLGAGMFQPHRAAGPPRGEQGQDQIGPPELALAAKSAAEEFGDHADVFRRQGEGVGDGAPREKNRLSGRVDLGPVPLPPADPGCGFQGMMIIDRRQIARV